MKRIGMKEQGTKAETRNPTLAELGVRSGPTE